MRRHLFTAEVFTPQRVRIGASVGAGVGAVVLCAALIGATAAPAATELSPQTSPAHGLLQIRFATPAPMAMPAPPQAGEQLAVLADPPADLAADPDLQSSRDLATIRQADAVQAHDVAVQAALWDRENAQIKAEIDGAMKSGPDVSRANAAAEPNVSGDPDVTAAAGDTRKAPPSAD